ncbi:hypothetical protein C922_05748 [Plasmodium inui San Antonio 1]|uniref:Uncharacterized protein n=1 Tax=Plasmodium inui San Antonio 1 TaxID=1237626 RepID=W6ZSI8_9APIC|nr:hypothetical protein C922_05748 [Plasmodium inui San Antonio 1]EUD63872.1 hypothetical protein C922_05748 [Plasmodium inui San Antonio 1]
MSGVGRILKEAIQDQPITAAKVEEIKKAECRNLRHKYPNQGMINKGPTSLTKQGRPGPEYQSQFHFN